MVVAILNAPSYRAITRLPKSEAELRTLLDARQSPNEATRWASIDDKVIFDALRQSFDADWAIESFDQSTSESFSATIRSENGRYKLILMDSVDGLQTVVRKVWDSRFDTIRSWPDLEETLEGFGNASWSIQTIERSGCVPTGFGDPTIHLVPLGSLFKLLLAAQISVLHERDLIELGSKLELHPHGYSVPSGSWHLLPVGTTKTIGEAIAQMLAHSDNTALDHLMDRIDLGLDDVLESQFGFDPYTPLMQSRDVYRLKWSVDSSVRDDYVRAISRQSRAEIVRSISQYPLPKLSGTEPPTQPFRIGWRATHVGICEAWRQLLMSDAVVWTVVKHATRRPHGNAVLYEKFGSEPGLLAYSVLVVSPSAPPIVLTLALWDESAGLDYATLAPLVQLMTNALVDAGRSWASE